MFGRKKKQLDEMDLPELPKPKMEIPQKFKEQFGEVQQQSQPRPIKQKVWQVVEKQIPAQNISKLVNTETGFEFEINSLEDVAILLNSLEEE